ncbi:MAG: glutaminase A [Legionellales bacterium]|nr:glutaminase A [Legionellales bacterium]
MSVENSISIQENLDLAIEKSFGNSNGDVAQYIPELSSQDPEQTAGIIRTVDNKIYSSGNSLHENFTLQSASKLVVLMGLLEEFGPEKVYQWVMVEPSGHDFNSVARLDQFGPYPSNPMLNAGAISLCSRIPGNDEAKMRWLDNWIEKLFNEKAHLNTKVFASERRTGDRNRALAYLLKSNNIINGDIEGILEVYFTLCSFEMTPYQSVYLPYLLANGGKEPNGEQVISESTVKQTISIMATCGLYNESGSHLVNTGMPSKSSVSGYIFAVVPGIAGIVTFSPRVNEKGTSIRGSIILEELSNTLGWHFGIMK